jgi:hypothetical protein
MLYGVTVANLSYNNTVDFPVEKPAEPQLLADTEGRTYRNYHTIIGASKCVDDANHIERPDAADVT